MLALLAALALAADPGDEPVPGAEPRYRAVLLGTTEPPEGWTRSQVLVVPAAQAAAIGKKLGADVASVSNTTFVVDGQRMKVNLIEGRTPGDAELLHRAMLKARGNSGDAVLRDGDTVVEFVGPDLRTVRRAHYILGLKPRAVTYRVEFDAAPIRACDYRTWNLAFNLFLEFDRRPGNKPSLRALAEVCQDYEFASEIRLRARGQGDTKSEWTVRPDAGPMPKTESDGEILLWPLGELPRKGVAPVVSVEGTVTSQAFAVTPSRRTAGPELTGPTSFWPADDVEIVALAREITGDAEGPREKLTALLDWFARRENIRYGGEVVGSRYGVPEILKRREGRCWDFSDLFVTLARGAGLPCRQIGGWYGNEGHVWAEVLLEGEGWLAVDPTAGMECGSEHVPIVTTETGEWPLVYASAIRVQRVEP